MKIIKIYDKNDESKFTFEIEGEHSLECDNIYNRLDNDNNQIEDFDNFKNLWITQFNKENDYKSKNFIRICQNIYNNKIWSFKYTEAKISNFINEWKRNTNRFNKTYFLENPMNRRGYIYLRNYTFTQTCTNKNKIVNTEFFIWASDFLIIRLRNSDYLKIDATFHYPKDFKQFLIIMYYDNVLERYIPAFYIIMNNKNECSYDLIFDNVTRLINMGFRDIKYFKTITTDNDTALINFVKNFSLI